MSTLDIYYSIISDQLPPYDQRLNRAMSEQQYFDYQHNTGHTYYHFLMKLVKSLKPKNVLELGTSIGRSGLFMMVSLPEKSRLTTIDIGSFLRTDLVDFAFDERLKIVYGDTLDKTIIGDLKPDVDLLFIDSEHTYDQVSAEWEAYKHLLVDDAIVVADDIRLNDMGKWWDSLPYDKVDTGIGLHFSGFGMFTFKNQK